MSSTDEATLPPGNPEDELELRRKQREERRKQRELELQAIADAEEKERLARKRAREERLHKQKCEAEGLPYTPLYAPEADDAAPAAAAAASEPEHETDEERERRLRIEAVKARHEQEAKETAQMDLALKEREKILRERLSATDAASASGEVSSTTVGGATGGARVSAYRSGGAVKSPREAGEDEAGESGGVLFRKYTAVKEELETATARIDALKEKLAQKEARIVDLESEAMTKDAKIKEQDRLLTLTLEKMKKLEQRAAAAESQSPELIAAEAIERERAERAKHEAAEKKRKADEAAAAAAAAEAAKAAERNAALEKLVAHSNANGDDSDGSDDAAADAAPAAAAGAAGTKDDGSDEGPRTSKTSKTKKSSKDGGKEPKESKSSKKTTESRKSERVEKTTEKTTESRKSEKHEKAEKDGMSSSGKKDKDKPAAAAAAAAAAPAEEKKADKKSDKKKGSSSAKKDGGAPDTTAPEAPAGDDGHDGHDGANLGAANDADPLGDGFVQADVRLYADFINNTLADDEHVGMELPVPLDGPDFFRLVANGIAPCKLLNKLVPGSVPDGDLTFIVTDDDDRRDNLKLCVDCAADVGCNVAGIDIGAVLKLKPAAILGFVYALLRAPLVKEMAGNAAARKLAGAGKAGAPLDNAAADAALLAWANAHVVAGGGTAADDLSTDWADGERYEQLLSAAAPHAMATHKRAIRKGAVAGKVERLAALVAAFEALGAPSLVAPRSLAAGAPRQHWVQLAALFCAEPLSNKK
jgi:hypothetical protein